MSMVLFVATLFFGFKYFVTFIDDYSRITWCILMREHSKFFVFCYHYYLFPQSHSILHTLCSDSLFYPLKMLYTLFHYGCSVVLVWSISYPLGGINNLLGCIFIGYSRLQKGYQCHCHLSRPTFISVYINFFEDSLLVFPFPFIRNLESIWELPSVRTPLSVHPSLWLILHLLQLHIHHFSLHLLQLPSFKWV